MGEAKNTPRGEDGSFVMVKLDGLIPFKESGNPL